jgi:Transglutaminase-like superfamily/Coenzyme PQQ synthesis protein D (PqqD)
MATPTFGCDRLVAMGKRQDRRTVVLAGTHRTGSGGRYRLGRDVYAILHDGQARLMDFHRGRFFTLDAVAAEMLTLALERAPGELVSDLASKYGVDPHEVNGDWVRLANELRRDGLLVPVESRPCPVAAPGKVRLFVLLAMAWLSFRLFGWAGTIRIWRRAARAECRNQPDAHSRPVVESIGRAVRNAAAGHLLNTECKERSLVAWYLLRHQFGLPTEIVAGAIPYPFQAHAWVECGPWTITDERANCDAYVPVARFQ